MPLALLVAGSVVLSPDLTLLDPVSGIWGLTQPWGNQTLTLSALQHPVTVIFDGAGTVHIYAQDDQDLMYAQGYTQASQRLFQMEAESLEAQGNLSSWVGGSAVASDIAFRTLGIPQVALEMQGAVSSVSPVLAQDLQAFCAGVNAYISWAESHDRLPLEFQTLGILPYTWTMADLFAFDRLLVLGQTTGIGEPVLAGLASDLVGDNATNQMFPVYPQYWQNFTVMPGNGSYSGGSLTANGISPSYLFSQDWLASWATGIPTGEERSLASLYEAALATIGDPYFPSSYPSGDGGGSNSWVVAANHSADGLPMVANDPHLPIMLPSLWIPTQLVDPNYDVEGWSLAGLPGVLIGHDPSVAWALTNSEGETALTYVETLRGNSYLENGTWHPLTIVNQTITVAGGPSRTLELESTDNGPLMARVGDYGLSLRWAADSPTWEAMAELEFDHAVSVTQFFSIMHQWWSVPNLNVLVAEDNVTSGQTHIGWMVPCHFPLINETLPDGQHVDVVGSRAPLNGSGAFEPVGYLGVTAPSPEVIDPAQGYLYAPNQPTVGQDFPYPFIGSFWDSGGRAHAIGTFLQTHPTMSIPLMEALQANVTDAWAHMFTPLLVQTLEDVSGGTDATAASVAKQALPLVEDWNGSFDENEVAPTLYTYWYNEMAQMDYDPVWKAAGISGAPDPFPNAYLYLAQTDPNSSWFPGGWAAFSTQALAAALDLLEKNLTAQGYASVSQWTWGVVHTFTLPSLTGKSYLADGPYPHWGDTYTVSVAPSETNLTTPLTEIALGSSLRMVAEPDPAQSDGGAAYGIIPGGATEDPASPYYDNQLPLWLAHEYVDMSLVPTSAGPFPQNVVATWTLQP